MILDFKLKHLIYLKGSECDAVFVLVADVGLVQDDRDVSVEDVVTVVVVGHWTIDLLAYESNRGINENANTFQAFLQ